MADTGVAVNSFRTVSEFYMNTIILIYPNSYRIRCADWADQFQIAVTVKKFEIQFLTILKRRFRIF